MFVAQARPFFLIALFLLAGPAVAATPALADNGPVIRVGATRAIKTIAEAARWAKEGDHIEVDAGDYVRDVAVWTKNNVHLRAVGGRARLLADGKAAEGKGIWVVRAEGISVEGFEFSGATVPDHNGAGIRLEKGSLSVRDCIFLKNQNGILTSSHPEVVLEIEDSEFGFNGIGDGLTHNLYVGAIARLSVTGSYFHHVRAGHLLKSRAAVNYIAYNRLTDEPGGQASYELEFSNGGLAYVIGNLIQQGSQTQNPYLISYGAEGYKWPRNEFYLINNTLVDDRPKGGVFLRIKPGTVTVKAINNLLVGGASRLETAGPGDYRHNFKADWNQFEQAAREDFRLKHNARLLGQATDAGRANNQALMPEREYLHPRKTSPLVAPARHPGALQSLK